MMTIYVYAYKRTLIYITIISYTIIAPNLYMKLVIGPCGNN